MISAVLAKILASKLALSGIALASGFLTAKIIPKLASKHLGGIISKALAAKGVNDPFVKERLQNITRETVLLAEYLVPDDGLGATKKAALKVWFDKLGLAGKMLYDLIDPIVAAADKELKAAAEKSKV